MSVLKFKNPNYVEGGAEEKWITLPTGGGIGDAPEDGRQYARKGNTWEAISLSEATASEAGLMSAADKTKVNNAVISDGTVLKIVYVTALPDEPDNTTLYIIPE